MSNIHHGYKLVRGLSKTYGMFDWQETPTVVYAYVCGSKYIIQKKHVLEVAYRVEELARVVRTEYVSQIKLGLEVDRIMDAL
jgi:hypothetical protein